MTIIRSFRNDDLPGLLSSYRNHWLNVGETPAVNAAILERSLLSTPQFNPKRLIVAVADHKVVGWCLFNRSHASQQTAEILSLCFAGEPGPHCGDDLLETAEKRAAEFGCTALTAGLGDARYSSLYGLSPLGGGVGIPTSDTPTSSLLSRRSYSITSERLRLVVDPTTYRPPIDREMLTLRRSTRIEQTAMLPIDGDLAAATSHLDLVRHHLINHRDGQTLAHMDVWLSDLEVALMEGSRAMLDGELVEARHLHSAGNAAGERHGQSPTIRSASPDPTHDGDLANVHRRFLTAGVVQALATRSIFHVEANVAADSAEANDLYLPLGFVIAERGRLWTKQIGRHS